MNINSSSNPPIMFNLFTFRRRVLSKDELELINGFYKKEEKVSNFSENEKVFYELLIREKQVLPEETYKVAEELIVKQFLADKKYNTEASPTIQLTHDCNMRCKYCYQKSYANHSTTLTENDIDNIDIFYERLSEKVGKNILIKEIEITGGETLLNSTTVDLINYISKKWTDSKLNILTNGLNVSKFINELPINNIDTFCISLDGTPDIHLKRRYENFESQELYDQIIHGIQLLKERGSKVRLSIVLDKNNYKFISDFFEFLKSKNLCFDDLLTYQMNVVTDYSKDLTLDERFNNKTDIKIMNEFFKNELGWQNFNLYNQLAKLKKLVERKDNNYSLPTLDRCAVNNSFNYFFSANKNVYFCHCIYENKGVIGSYSPTVEIDIDKITKLINRYSLLSEGKCKNCSYKFVCRGGCPSEAEIKGIDTVCSVFKHEDILDELCFNYPYSY